MPELTSSRLAEEFPGNEWLVADIYDQFRDDPASVDRKWVDIFRRLEAETSSSDSTSNGASAQKSAAKGTGASSSGSTKAGAGREAVDAKPTAGNQRPNERSTPATATPAEPAESQKPDGEKPDEKRQKSSGSNGRPKAPSRPTTRRTSGSRTPIPSDPTKSELPKDKPDQDKEDQHTPLKGMSKAIAANMDASLEVPTATTVRAIPAKLLIDNRTVINNHLKRTRGGKVSFTHLVGYAMIKALNEFPEMNVTYDVIDGKPTAIQPAHVNFGLAIDLPRPDGTRALIVPSVKGAEELRFTQWWAPTTTSSSVPGTISSPPQTTPEPRSR